jgi:hypothetical protein
MNQNMVVQAISNLATAISRTVHPTFAAYQMPTGTPPEKGATADWIEAPPTPAAQ